MTMKHREVSSECTESQHESLSRFPVDSHFYASKEARPMRTATLCSSAHLQFAPDDRADPRLFGAPGPTWTGAPPAWTSLTPPPLKCVHTGNFCLFTGNLVFFIAEVLQIAYFPLHVKNDTLGWYRQGCMRVMPVCVVFSARFSSYDAIHTGNESQ